MAIVNVNSDNFESCVLNNEKPVLVDFWASWCGPCKMLAPELEKLAARHDEIDIAKINVDESPEFAALYRISAIPAMKLFKNGSVVAEMVGYHTADQIEPYLNK